jgi:uncharacterized protein (DUF1778 family)
MSSAMTSPTPARRSPKAQRLEARITAEQKEIFRQAAALSGRSVSAFVTYSALDAARRLIRENRVVELSTSDARKFVGALLRPQCSNPGLRRALAQHSKAGLR